MSFDTAGRPPALNRRDLLLMPSLNLARSLVACQPSAIDRTTKTGQAPDRRALSMFRAFHLGESARSVQPPALTGLGSPQGSPA